MGLYIDGMTAYATGETTDFSTVGVKAIDDYTLQYTLVEPCTYFMSMFQDLTFLPMCRSYFLSQGGAFGIAEYAEASASPSYTYGIDQNHIAYCGQFLCTNLTERNSVNYVLNESYWNADNVSITSIQLSYDDGTDTNRAYTDFMNGDTVQFAREPTIWRQQRPTETLTNMRLLLRLAVPHSCSGSICTARPLKT